MTDRTAIIVGGGIGGLAAGLALCRDGWTVEVLEQAPEIYEVGAGLQISPNGMRILDEWGITPRLEASLFEPDAIELRTGKLGLRVFSIKMGAEAVTRWGGRFVQVHRADLQGALMEAFTEAGGTIRTGLKITGYVRQQGGASIYIDGEDRLFGDLVIGADGVRSAIREQMLGADRARFTGNVAWRAVVPLDALGSDAPPPRGVIWAGRKKHAVTTRIRSGSLVNFVGIIEQDNWQEEGWSIPGEKSELSREFEGWHRSVRSVIDASDGQLFRWALFSRKPLRAWSDGPVGLLGDAAHPMLPSMAQGAVQAIEDAVVLARCVSEETPDAGLLKYHDIRKPRVTRIQQRSLFNLKLYHRRNLASQILSYGPLGVAGRIAPKLMARQQDWIYGFKA